MGKHVVWARSFFAEWLTLWARILCICCNCAAAAAAAAVAAAVMVVVVLVVMVVVMVVVPPPLSTECKYDLQDLNRKRTYTNYA